MNSHAVTIVVEASISAPVRPPLNSLEITELGLFDRESLPASLSHGMSAMLADALVGATRFE